MPNEHHSVSRNAKWAIAQTLISACVLFFLYRFLLQELGAAKLGLWSLVLASTSLARLGELGFSSATLRFVGKYLGANQPKDAAEILETAVLSISLPFLVLAAIAIPLIGVMLPWFVPSQHMGDALVIIPWAMLSLWLGVTGGLVQSAIDGCGRMDLRNMVLIGTSLLYLAIAVMLAPLLGLKGVAIAQAVQAGASLMIMWWLAKANINSLNWFPWRWQKHRFKEIASFAVTMQAGSIAGMFVEPLTKAYISRFGGLEFLAFFDMANQVITRARSVLVSGFQAITPQFALTNNPSKHRELFLQSQNKVLDLGIPFMAVVMMGFPFLSEIWVGHKEPIFIISGQIIGATWVLVTLMTPAYFFLTGTGRGYPVAAAQIITLIGTALFGWVGGMSYSQFGPIIGAAIALLIGNIYAYKTVWVILFSKASELAAPKWIATRFLKSGVTYALIVSINILASSYLTTRWEYLTVLTLLLATIAYLVFDNLRKQNISTR